MKRNWLVLAAAAVYGLAGFALLFAGSEVLEVGGVTPSPAGEWLCQLAAGAILGLASLNWLQRFSVTSGILGRPLLLANLTFTTVSFFASIRAWKEVGGTLIIAGAVIFGVLSLGLGMRLFQRTGLP